LVLNKSDPNFLQGRKASRATALLPRSNTKLSTKKTMVDFSACLDQSTDNLTPDHSRSTNMAPTRIKINKIQDLTRIKSLSKTPDLNKRMNKMLDLNRRTNKMLDLHRSPNRMLDLNKTESKSLDLDLSKHKIRATSSLH
jgi:hypothetical protein